MRPLVLLLLAGCGQSLVVPLHDESAVLSRHPALRGRIVPAEAYRPTTPPEMWSEEDAELRVGSVLRLRADGIDERRTVPAGGQVDFPVAGRIACAGRRLFEVRNDLDRALGGRPVTLSLLTSDVLVVGMTNYEGRLRGAPDSLRAALILAQNPSRRACLTQIIVLSNGRAVVCDFYRHLTEKDEAQNVRILPGDVIVVPELYDPDRIPVAPEWGPIEQHLTGKIDRMGLARAIHRCSQRLECSHFR